MAALLLRILICLSGGNKYTGLVEKLRSALCVRSLQTRLEFLEDRRIRATSQKRAGPNCADKIAH
jgi:hypothetical protein